MKKRNVSALMLPLIFVLVHFSCIKTSQNKDTEGGDILERHQVTNEMRNINFRDTVYVPVYAEIYSQTKDVKFRLTTTLSIRNTSLRDTMFINAIEYYDTGGKLVRNYLNSSINLQPLETIDYVIEDTDLTGGTGANFIISQHKN